MKLLFIEKKILRLSIEFVLDKPSSGIHFCIPSGEGTFAEVCVICFWIKFFFNLNWIHWKNKVVTRVTISDLAIIMWESYLDQLLNYYKIYLEKLSHV